MADLKHETRPLCVIAREIVKTWAKPNFAAVPYLRAMLTLNSIEESYMLDSARSIVNYFLANAGSWRGEDARRIKAELKEMVK